MLRPDGALASSLVSAATGFKFSGERVGSVIMRNGWPVAAFVFHNWQGCELHLTAAVRGVVPVKDLRQIAAEIFASGAIQRVVVKVSEADERLKRRLPRLGFELEALAPDYFGLDEAAMVFVLLRSKQRLARLESEAPKVSTFAATTTDESGAPRYHS
jgi:hypothetical protein